MAETLSPTSNYETFRECLSDIVIQQLAPVSAPKRKKRTVKAGRKKASQPDNVEAIEAPAPAPATTDAEDLIDFVEYLACEIYACFPIDLQGLSYATVRNDEDIAAAYTSPLPASTVDRVSLSISGSALDSLVAYGLLASPEDLQRTILEPLLTSYTAACTAPPPALDLGKRAPACEICERDWIPLTYHHLIPRSSHAKVLKRGWHEEWRLNSVAWLCRACHSMVHRLESNDELARNWYSVNKLLDRDEVRAFASWVGGVRWKSR